MIVTLLTSILWVSFGVYRAVTVKPAVSVPQTISNPITPSLNQTAIKQIESGIYFDSSQIPDIVVTASSSPLPVPTISPIVTPISSPSAMPTGP
jgi:hypothetical protein